MNFRVSAILLVALVVSVAAAPVMAEKISDKEAARLKTYIFKHFGPSLPPGTELKVSGFEPSGIKGLKKGVVTVSTPRGSGKIEFLLSQDGKYLILGTPADVKSFQSSKVKGFKKGELMVGNRPLGLLVSEDGRFIIAGDVLDTTVDPLKSVLSKIDLRDVPYRGAKNAKVTVVEYSDFQCPYCRRASQMLPKLLDEYEGKVKLVYKQLPLPMHKWARLASASALCVYEQSNDKFWKFHDMVFANQRQINEQNARDKFTQFAKDIGVDMTKFNSCIDSPQVKDRIEKEMKEAQSLGVNSTPSFFVNGMLVRGADYARLKAAVESALAGKI